MLRVRTARESDIDGVLKLAHQAFPGMTTLPPERDVLASKLSASVNSVIKAVQEPADETYFLVMEDGIDGPLVGTAAIIASLGQHDEFYSYQLNKVTQSCKELDKKVSFETLNLTNHFEGFAEVATLFLSPEYRKHGNGKLLAKSRYLFMAQFRQRFPESVMADLRGYFDDHGRSPFWEAVGRYFFEMEFAEADLYGAINGNQFIQDLMPKQPIYVNLLPEEAQRVIGRPNVKGKPALEMLRNEGFEWHGFVDIFDAAPSVDTHIDDITTITDSSLATVTDTFAESRADDVTAIIANSELSNFATTRGELRISNAGEVAVHTAVADALQLSDGSSIRFVRL
ncbi:MAG: arginine N-succinyltransferase [Gammaproteobacteria bacterium]|nr:arginine N-succinyltransferase [Gammaproteobacteria bacterium]